MKRRKARLSWAIPRRNGRPHLPFGDVCFCVLAFASSLRQQYNRDKGGRRSMVSAWTPRVWIPDSYLYLSVSVCVCVVDLTQNI